MMVNKKIWIIGILLVLLPFVLGQVNVCCERTEGGAWCQNSEPGTCNSSYREAPTSCDTTSYCKPGCCYDSLEGLCWESTPQRVCDASGGSWTDDPDCNIPQCNLGCCVLGDQGALVTLTRCKQMAGFYGLNTDFRTNIVNEIECIAIADSQEKGACVYEADYQRLCKFTTRGECSTAGLEGIDGTITNDSTGFYAGILCSADELATNCGPSTDTIMIEGRDEIYFKDTCGNPANIYDAARINDNIYWKEIYSKDESCGAGSGNAGSQTCGNCDYFLGSIGKMATSSTGTPTYGDYICVGLNCKNGKQHGESWCVKDSPSGGGKDPVGSRYYKHVCIFNEVIVEPCADFRNEICLEGSTNGFSEAACRANRWQTCLGQLEDDDCENDDLRDCVWIGGYYYNQTTGTIYPASPKNLTPQGVCVPEYPPGFVFWSTSGTASSLGSTGTGEVNNFGSASLGGFSGSSASSSGSAGSSSSMCSAASTSISVEFKGKYEDIGDVVSDLFGGDDELEWECDGYDKFCDLMGDDPDNVNIENLKVWAREMNTICAAMGDCGGGVNWQGTSTDDGFAAYSDGKRFLGSAGAETIDTSSSTTTTTTNTDTSALGGLTG